MAGKIPQHFIDELMNRVDLVEVIDARVPLRKAGRDYVACCPFHSEKTPSFTVSAVKQFYHCFGCGAHGTAIGFLMEYDHMDFVEAVEELAARVGLQIPREAGTVAKSSDSDALYSLLEQAAAYYRRQLREHPAAARAVEYLKHRGLTGEIAAEFGIGFAPPGWDGLLHAFGQDAARRTLLARAGLVIEKSDGGVYDRFRERVMFPIRDRRGRVVAFGGRVLDDSTPKYLNSPETAVFHKGRELYGLYEARMAMKRLDRLLIVEGYMDVVALAQYGLRNVVATLGTAVTREHLEQALRAAPEVVFCFDGDQAGREAAWRALENTLPVMREGRQARFLLLPEGEDPDTLVRKEGRDALTDRIEHAIPFSTFFYQELERKTDMTSIDGRARLVELAGPLLSKLPDGVFRHMMTEHLAERARLDVRQLSRHISPAAAKSPAKPRTATPRTLIVRTPVRLALVLVLHYPRLAQQVENPCQLEGLQSPGISLLIRVLELLKAQPHINTAALMERLRDTDDGRHVGKLMQMNPPPGSETDIEREFSDTIRHLLELHRQQRWDYLQEKLRRKESLNQDEKTEWKQMSMFRHHPK